MKIIISEEQLNRLKQNLLESTETGSAGSYETPSFIGSRFLKKPIYFSEKGNDGTSMLKGKNAQFVKIKEKCKKFPYCEQGDSIEFPKSYKLNKTKLKEEKVKRDRCLRIADRKYDKPSAYKSGAVVQCRKGKIWKNLKEDVNVKDTTIENLPNFLYHATFEPLLKKIKVEGLGGASAKKNWEDSKSGVVYLATEPDLAYDYIESLDEIPDSWYEKIIILVIDTKKLDKNNLYIDENELTNQNDNYEIITFEYHGIIEFDSVVKILTEKDLLSERSDFSKEKKQGLHGWFSRRGGKGGKGWVDCNTCRNGKCKSCGRQEGEKRSKYPSCRPTPSQCKNPGKGKTWGKTK